MNLGPTELLIILGIVLLLFGSTRLPKLARSLGQASKEFKQGVEESSKDDSSSDEAKGSKDDSPADEAKGSKDDSSSDEAKGSKDDSPANEAKGS